MIETTSETSITPGQGGFERRFEQYNPSPTLNALSWDQITSHRVDTRTGSKCPQKWNPNGRTLGDKLATTTLFRRSQIRQSRFSLLPIITDQIGKNKYTNDDVVGFAHRGAAVTPNPGQRRGTDPATAFFIEKEEVAEIPNNMSFLKRKSITKKELAPITLFSPSPTPLSKDSLCESDLCLSPNRGSEEESAPSAQEVTSEYSRYELEFHPRIKKTLTPLAWKSKSSSTQSCDKLTEHFGFFGAKSQNGIGSKSRGFQSRKRHSTGQTPVNNPGTRNAPRETRRKSSGSNAVSSLRNRRPVVPEIPRGAVLIAQLKRGLSFSRLTAAIDSIRDSFNVSEKKEKEMDSVGPRGFCDAPVEGEGESSAVTGEYDYSTGFDEMSCSREYNAGATTPTAIKLLQCSSAQHSLLQDISENPLDCLAMAIASS